MIRYTKKVRSILNFIDEYGFITAKICGYIFYKDTKTSIEQGRHKLTALYKNGDLIISKNQYGKEYLYKRESKSISSHKFLLLNLYAEIFNIVDNVEYFQMEENWQLSKKKSDAHIIFSNNIDGETVLKSYLIEYDKHHNTEFDKYNTIYATGEVQKWYSNRYDEEGLFPNIIQINHNGIAKIDNNNKFSVVGLDYDFNELIQRVIL